MSRLMGFINDKITTLPSSVVSLDVIELSPPTFSKPEGHLCSNKNLAHSLNSFSLLNGLSVNLSSSVTLRGCLATT